MLYGNGLSFSTLSEYNKDRVGYFRHGGLEGWNVAEWSNAIAGETGELCNLTKKIIRGDFDGDSQVLLGGSAQLAGLTPVVLSQVADELADIVIYCDLLAQKCGINLGQAVMDKFNRVSGRVDYKGIMRAE